MADVGRAGERIVIKADVAFLLSAEHRIQAEIPTFSSNAPGFPRPPCRLPLPGPPPPLVSESGEASCGSQSPSDAIWPLRRTHAVAAHRSESTAVCSNIVCVAFS